MQKKLLVILVMLAVSLAMTAGAVNSLAPMMSSGTIGNEPGTDRTLPDSLPPEYEVNLIQSGIDYGGGPTTTPVAYNENRGIVTAPYTVTEEGGTAALWGFWETGANDQNEVYSKYYHSFYGFWDGPYQVSQTENDAGRVAVCVTDNGMLHAVYHGDHDPTGAYHIAYVNHSGIAFDEWSDPELIDVDMIEEGEEGYFPNIIGDGNNVYVSYKCYWQTPDQRLHLQHGVWNEDEQTMTWWDADDIKMITESQCGWLTASMFPDTQGNLHIAYGQGESQEGQIDVGYRWYDVETGVVSDEEIVAYDGGTESNPGPCYVPSLVVDSNDEVHISYHNSYSGGWYEIGNLGVCKYVHGTSGDWSSPEVTAWNDYMYEEAAPDSYCTYPIVGIDENDDIWITYTNHQFIEDGGEWLVGGCNLMLGHKPADSEDWAHMTMIGYEEEMLPNYPQITHRVIERPGVLFAQWDDENMTSSVLAVTGPEIETGVEDVPYTSIPKATALEQNYPNPFNPTTNIGFQLTEKSHVELDIYNVKGELVKTLVNEERDPSYYSVVWDGTNNAGNSVSSGTYVYRLTTANKTESKSMVLLK